VHYLSARVRVAALDIPRLAMRCAATRRGAVAIDDAVWHDVVLLLLDFDETHGAFSVPCDRKVANLDCDRDVIRAAINVGLDERDGASHE
jgi:hypothetical protein